MTKQIFLLFFFLSSCLDLQAQEKKYAYSLELGITRNATIFFGGDPFSLAAEAHDNFNYAVHPMSGFYLRGSVERKLIKNLSIDVSLGFLRCGYQGRHLDSFSLIPMAPGVNDLFVRSEKWTDYAINNLTASLGLNYSIKNKIILRGAFLFQLPLWVNEKAGLAKLYEFRQLNTLDLFSKETTGRFKELFTGWECSIKFNIWRKVYLNMGYQQLFDNRMDQPYFDENYRAPHFKQTLFAGLYVINAF
jgi:hypothetical protein